MAKLYAELTSHDNKRIAKKSDNTCIKVDLYHKNEKIGTVGLYQVHSTDGYRVTWSTGQGWTGNEVITEKNTA